ncbi:hypothetical protein [Piscirickettsia salmonis]|uniref:hypothetical protein n=1 Tax=Piscirickettsia salmonis TaxID=1238 RepID=UPI003A8096E5
MPKNTPKIIKLKNDQYEKIRHFRFLKNDSKARVWTSKYRVRSHIVDKVISDYCKKNKSIYILSGSHGNKSGDNAITNKELKEKSFFIKDKLRYEAMSPRIKVIDISTFTKKECKTFIKNSSIDILLFYCYSRNDAVAKEALRCASPEALYTRETPPPTL